MRAKRLPVTLIPEEALVAAMRHHVVYDGRRCSTAGPRAPIVYCEKRGTSRAPLVTVSASGSTRACRIMAPVACASARDLTFTALAMGNRLSASANVRRTRHQTVMPSRKADRLFRALRPARSKSGSRPSSTFCCRCSAFVVLSPGPAPP